MMTTATMIIPATTATIRIINLGKSLRDFRFGAAKAILSAAAIGNSVA